MDKDNDKDPCITLVVIGHENNKIKDSWSCPWKLQVNMKTQKKH